MTDSNHQGYGLGDTRGPANRHIDVLLRGD